MAFIVNKNPQLSADPAELGKEVSATTPHHEDKPITPSTLGSSPQLARSSEQLTCRINSTDCWKRCMVNFKEIGRAHQMSGSL